MPKQAKMGLGFQGFLLIHSLLASGQLGPTNIRRLDLLQQLRYAYAIPYVTGPAKTDHVSTNYTELYFC